MTKVKEITPKVEVKESREVARPFGTLGASLEDFMESMFPGRWMEPMGLRRSLLPDLEMKLETQWPKIDVIDHEADIVVRAELPGVSKDDLELTVSEDSMRLKATTASKKVEDEESFYRCETHRGAYERFVQLPMDVDSERAEAVLKDGVLEVKIPKRKVVKRHQVEVK